MSSNAALLNANVGAIDRALIDPTASLFTRSGQDSIKSANWIKNRKVFSVIGNQAFGTTMQIDLDRSADFVGKVFLQIKVPKAKLLMPNNELSSSTFGAYVSAAGFAMIDYVELTYGSNSVQRISGDALVHLYRKKATFEQAHRIQRMIGADSGFPSARVQLLEDGTDTNEGYREAESISYLVSTTPGETKDATFIVPLPMFWCQSSRPSGFFPLNVLPNELRFNIRLKPQSGFTYASSLGEATQVSVSTVAPEVSLLADYYHVPPAESNALMSYVNLNGNALEWMFYDHDLQTNEVLVGGATPQGTTIKLSNIKQAVTSLLYSVRRNESVTDSGNGKLRDHDFYSIGGINRAVLKNDGTGWTTDKSPMYRKVDQWNLASTSINIFESADARELDVTQHQWPDVVGGNIYGYSFEYYPDVNAATGHLNFSNLHNPTINIKGKTIEPTDRATIVFEFRNFIRLQAGNLYRVFH